MLLLTARGRGGGRLFIAKKHLFNIYISSPLRSSVFRTIVFQRSRIKKWQGRREEARRWRENETNGSRFFFSPFFLFSFFLLFPVTERISNEPPSDFSIGVNPGVYVCARARACVYKTRTKAGSSHLAVSSKLSKTWGGEGGWFNRVTPWIRDVEGCYSLCAKGELVTEGGGVNGRTIRD